MFKVLVKLLILCLFTLFICNVAKSEQNKTDYSDYGNESSDYSGTENSIKSNSTEDYDYNQLIEDNQCEEKPSFLQKLKLLHNEGKNLTLRKHVKHINQTFELIRNVQTVFKSLFSTDGRAGLELLEFLSEIDLQISSECSSALYRIMTAMRNFDLWALKCKSKVENSIIRLCYLYKIKPY